MKITKQRTSKSDVTNKPFFSIYFFPNGFNEKKEKSQFKNKILRAHAHIINTHEHTTNKLDATPIREVRKVQHKGRVPPILH